MVDWPSTFICQRLTYRGLKSSPCEASAMASTRLSEANEAIHACMEHVGLWCAVSMPHMYACNIMFFAMDKASLKAHVIINPSFIPL